MRRWVKITLWILAVIFLAAGIAVAWFAGKTGPIGSAIHQRSHPRSRAAGGVIVGTNPCQSIVRCPLVSLHRHCSSDRRAATGSSERFVCVAFHMRLAGSPPSLAAASAFSNARKVSMPGPRIDAGSMP